MEVLSLNGRVFAFVLVMLLMTAVLQGDNETEEKVKAAFILNFTHFVKWPESAPLATGDSFTICVAASGEFDQMLEETVKDKSFDGHPFVTRRLRKETDIRTCQVAFFASGAIARSAPGVLTITDNESPGSGLAAINFVLDSNRVRFSINRQAAEHAGLTISSKLLSLAVRMGHE